MKKYRWTALSTLFILFSVVASGQNKTTLSADEFEDRINRPGIQVLDVRTPQEYANGHIKNSLQADWLNKEQFRERVEYLDKTKPLYVYCGSGVRSSDAAKWLRNNGFQHVFELQNGIITWKKNNSSIETDSIVKQMRMTEYKSLLNGPSIVLVDFGAKWCPPCKKMDPVLEQLQNDLGGKFILKKIDAGIHTNIMQQVHADKLPTFILYKNGKEIWRKDGLVTLEEFKSHIE